MQPTDQSSQDREEEVEEEQIASHTPVYYWTKTEQLA